MSNNLKTMTGRISTFWSLYNEKIIYIPKIQRDYVQGRKNVQVISNRGEFVAQLINALEKKTPLMLNFIYGYNDENRFVPIDGQQRLTTLYLLHIYYFQYENQPILRRRRCGYAQPFYRRMQQIKRFTGNPVMRPLRIWEAMFAMCTCGIPTMPATISSSVRELSPSKI